MKKKAGNRRKKGRVLGMILAILLVIAIGVGGIHFLRIRVENSCDKAMMLVTEQNRTKVVQELKSRMVYLDVLAKLLSGTAEGDTRLPDMKKMKTEAKALEVGIYYDQDGQYYLSDGYVGTFADTSMRDSVEGKSYAVMTAKISEISSKTCLVVVLPIIENEKACGIVFGLFDLQEFMSLFSKSVYEENGFSFLADAEGNIIIASESIAKIDENGDIVLEIPDNTDKLKELVTEACGQGMERPQQNYINVGAGGQDTCVYGLALEEFTDLAIISVVDESTIKMNVFKVSSGVAGATCILVLLLLIQFIIMLTSEKTKKKEIAEAVNIDDLTGLATKSYHKKQCEAILKKAKVSYAYVVMDVSDFSAINAASGYEFGNTVLKNIANVLSAEMANGECCSRTSADHYSALLKYDNQEKLVQRIYSICEKAGNLPEEAKSNAGKYKKENIIFNCGVYLIQSNNEEINRIRARANTARKTLKKAVTTQIGFYNDDDFRKKMENHELELELLKAIDNKELVVYLQPKYGAMSEKMTGAEALVRWNHPTKGMIGPNVFIPIAEADGYVKHIDFFVFETVCKKLSEWKAQGFKEMVVSVNFSRLHLLDEDFVHHLGQVADTYGVAHGNLEIELTETADFNDMDELLNVMYRIKDAGFGLAMDDFGSGYSSLQLLMKMPAGVLKMDKSLIDDCKKENEVDNKMAADIISLAQGRGHHVVAEGVETEEQKDILRDANCDMIQGYYYSKPISIADFEVLLAE